MCFRVNGCAGFCYVLEIFIENSHVSLSSKTLGNINRGFYMTDVFLLRLSSEFRIFFAFGILLSD